MNREELLRIKEVLQRDDFYDVLSDNLFKLRLNDNICIFYQNNKCSIYNNRPLDCRLYPFDIIKDKEKYYLILYLLECIDYKIFIEETSSIDSLISGILHWIDEFTDERNFSKMKKRKYKIIREIVCK